MSNAIEQPDDVIREMYADLQADDLTVLKRPSAVRILEYIQQLQAENAELKQCVKQLENDFLDAVDCKTGIGPTALSTLIAERDSLKQQVEELQQELMNTRDILYKRKQAVEFAESQKAEIDQLKAKLNEARKLLDDVFNKAVVPMGDGLHERFNRFKER